MKRHFEKEVNPRSNHDAATKFLIARNGWYSIHLTNRPDADIITQRSCTGVPADGQQLHFTHFTSGFFKSFFFAALET